MEHELQQFVVLQGIAADLQEALAGAQLPSVDEGAPVV